MTDNGSLNVITAVKRGIILSVRSDNIPTSDIPRVRAWAQHCADLLADELEDRMKQLDFRWSNPDARPDPESVEPATPPVPSGSRVPE